ncbi:hypothetical protein V8B97DRAFT_1967333 [Scleroderma yunnanense]
MLAASRGDPSSMWMVTTFQRGDRRRLSKPGMSGRGPNSEVPSSHLTLVLMNFVCYFAMTTWFDLAEEHNRVTLFQALMLSFFAPIFLVHSQCILRSAKWG